MRHTIQWMAPSPLWAEAAVSTAPPVRRAMRQPALLRFSTDTFMEEFAATLEHDPRRLADFLARPETWREPTPEPNPLERAPEFIRKLGRAREAVNRTLDAASRTSTPTAARGAAGLIGRAPASASVAARLSAAKLSAARTAASARPLKLYQPAHQRFYLVTAALVCRVAGLPDHALDTARDERVGYVVRRMIQPEPDKDGRTPPAEEYAFVVSSSGQGWQKVAGAGNELVADEELLSLFPFNFGDTDGRRRRLFGAMIPVGRREAYMGAGIHTTPRAGATTAAGTTRKTARKIHFQMQVAEPWKNLLRAAADAKEMLDTAGGEDSSALSKDSREQSQMVSWYLLLDLADYLKKFLPAVWAAVEAGNSNGLTKNSPAEALYKELNAEAITPALKDKLVAGTHYKKETHVPDNMAAALRRIEDPAGGHAARLEQNAEPYDRGAAPGHNNWPDFIFPLADLELPDQVALPSASIPPAQAGDESKEDVTLSTQGVPSDLSNRQARIDNLVALVVRALPADAPEQAPPPPAASRAPFETREATFRIRCVYERPFCGPLDPPVVSEPSAEFQLAGFFDPDAPARAIRIALPIDTTPAGLRKFDKNTAFMISDVLCGQMQRLKGITFGHLVRSVLPWPFHKSLSSRAPAVGPCKSKGVDIGMICTFSLPIITICALILLMVIVLLFDIIFRWIPWFIMCFPLPRFKGKR